MDDQSMQHWYCFVVYCLCSLSEVQTMVDFYFCKPLHYDQLFVYLENDSKLIGVVV